MSDLPQHPDALWAVLKTLVQPGHPALSYQEISSVTELSHPTISRCVTTLVDHEWATLDRHGRFYRVTVTAAGVEANEARAEQPTGKAVVAVARQICREEATLQAADPYYRPYAPSDRHARALCQQYGPETAIAELQRRRAERRHRYVTQEAISLKAERDREENQKEVQSELTAHLKLLTAGQRLDRALNKLVTQSTAPTARMEDAPVTDGGGGKDDANAVPNLHDDTVGWAQRRVTRLIEDLEKAAGEHERRRCAFEREAVA